MRGYRNLAIITLYLALCAWMAWIAGPDHVGDIGDTLAGVGLPVALAIGGRAANKWAEAKAGKAE